MWRLGFFLHEMGFGLLSVFLPLYIVAVGGSLTEIGMMSALALLLAIPASFFWGYICDKTRHYKRYILLSFLASAIILYLFTTTRSIGFLILLYAVMSILHVAHEAPKNVLIAEFYSREDWDRSFAFYEGFTEAGWLIGLVLGFLTSAFGVGSLFTLLLCSILNLAAFVVSAILVTDPILVFERGLVRIEKTVDFAYRGVFFASRVFDGFSVSEKLRRENVGAFCSGLVLFSLATSILFTPMPIFISEITAAAGLPPSFVFAIFVLNSGGAVSGYFLASSHSDQQTGRNRVSRVTMFRSFLAFLLIAALFIPIYNVALATMILMLLGFVYALFLVYTLSLSMELIPAGRAGLFNLLIGVGGAFGSFLGPVVAQAFGFPSVFIIAGVIFLLAYFMFKFFA